MYYIKNVFAKFKCFLVESIASIKTILSDLSFKNMKEVVNYEYKSLRRKLADIKGTNWDLAQYHFIAGNHNDGLMRFKLLQMLNYRAMESNYFIGRIYFEKGAYPKAKKHLELYLASQNNEFVAEAEYCMALMSNKKIQVMPKSIILQKRNRIALNLDRSTMDNALLVRYQVILQALKSEIGLSFKVLEAGCYIGVFGRIFRERFADNLQYFAGTEIGRQTAEVARKMHVGTGPVYDNIKVCDDISQIASDGNTYSLVIIPDILMYYSDLPRVFQQVFSSLHEEGAALFVVRIIRKDSAAQEQIETSVTFINPIEEFSYAYDYVVQSIESVGFKFKTSSDISDEFTLFIVTKNK